MPKELNRKKYYFKLCVSVFVNICHMTTGKHKVKKRAQDHMDMELQEVVNHLIWVLRTILRSFGRAVCTFYY